MDQSINMMLTLNAFLQFNGKITYNDKGEKSIQFIGKNATIYVNPDNGRITTAHKTHTKLKKKLEAKNNEK